MKIDTIYNSPKKTAHPHTLWFRIDYIQAICLGKVACARFSAVYLWYVQWSYPLQELHTSNRSSYCCRYVFQHKDGNRM